jgi:hypothetical protein
MRDGRSPGRQFFLASTVAALLAAAVARAQTPIPTLPPLPPLPAASEAPTPVAAVEQPPAALPTPAPALGASPVATVPAPAPTRAAEERPRAPEPAGGLPSSVLLLLGIGVLVLVATLVVVLTVLLKKPVVINVPSRSAAPPPVPEGPPPAGWTAGDVVHAGQPPAGVLDVLPGRFLVEDGDEQTELRIFRTAPGDRVETTIGRDPGPPYRHIQLLPASVSAKHAKLVFDKRSWSLINYARSNPTRVNGEEIEENASRRLVDNDRIEIGDVVMTFRED